MKNDQLDDLYIPDIGKIVFDNVKQIYVHPFWIFSGSHSYFLPDEYFKKIIFLQSRELSLCPLKISGSSEVGHFPKSVILTGNGS